MEFLSSKNNDNIKYAKKLMLSGSFRKSEGKFLAEGIRICNEVLENNIEIDTVFYTKICYEKHKEFLDKIVCQSLKSFVVTEEIIKLISDTCTPQGVACVCNQKKMGDVNFFNSDNLILLENIQNPSNMGSIFRTCDALNVNNVIISNDSCDIFSPKVLRGSMGSVLRINSIVSENFTDTINDLKINGFKVYATSPSGDAFELGKFEFSKENSDKKIAVVLGNEGNGVTDKTMSICDKKLKIPMNPRSESLNVSVAAGIIIWEMVKNGG